MCLWSTVTHSLALRIIYLLFSLNWELCLCFDTKQKGQWEKWQGDIVDAGWKYLKVKLLMKVDRGETRLALIFSALGSETWGCFSLSQGVHSRTGEWRVSVKRSLECMKGSWKGLSVSSRHYKPEGNFTESIAMFKSSVCTVIWQNLQRSNTKIQYFQGPKIWILS